MNYYRRAGDQESPPPNALQHVYSRSSQRAVICQWVGVSPGIHLFVSKQPVDHRAGTSCLPVPLTSSLESHRCWVLRAAPRTSTDTASFKVKAKFTQSWASTGCPAASWGWGIIKGGSFRSKNYAQTKGKARQKEKQRREKKGGGEANSEVLSQVSFVWEVTQWLGKSVVGWEFVMGFA